MDVRTGARWMIERARAARDAGLDSLFVGDHHNVPVPYYQNVPMLGRLLAEWDDRPAGALFLLPLWHPVLVAEQIGTLASIAAGPFIMQCAVGGGSGAVRRARTSRYGTRPSRFEAALDIVRRLCAGEEVDDRRAVRDRAGAHRAGPAASRSRCGSAAAAPPAIDRAARLGDAFLIGPEATPDAGARRSSTTYRDACARHGRTPATIAVRRDVHVGADDADASPGRGPDPRRAATAASTPRRPSSAASTRVAEAFAELGAMGCTDVIVRHLADDQDEVLRVVRTARRRAGRAGATARYGSVEPRWVDDAAALAGLDRRSSATSLGTPSTPSSTASARYWPRLALVQVAWPAASR